VDGAFVNATQEITQNGHAFGMTFFENGKNIIFLFCDEYFMSRAS